MRCRISAVDPARAVRAETVDAAALYAKKRAELTELVLGLSAVELERRVPATPAWRVRDAFAHVVGINTDLNAGNYGRDDPAGWTAAQVDRSRGRSVADLAAEWERESVTFEAGLRLFGYELGSHYVGDLHAHLQDVRSTLGLPADRDELTVLVALDFYLESTDAALRDASPGAMEIHAGAERHQVGDGEIVATVVAEPFEILRALSSRRSLRQIRSLEWTGDAETMAARMSRYPLPEADLHD